MPIQPINARRLAIALKLLNPDFPPIPPDAMEEASRFVRFIAACVNRTNDTAAILNAAERDGWGKRATEDYLRSCLDEDFARYPDLFGGLPLPPPAEDPLETYCKTLSALNNDALPARRVA